MNHPLTIGRNTFLLKSYFFLLFCVIPTKSKFYLYHQDLWELCAVYKQLFLLFTTQSPSLTLLFMKDSNCFQKEMTTIEKQEHARIASNYNGILLPKLFWPTVRKNCSSDPENLLKFEAEGREFSNFLRSLEQFIQTVKGQNNSW